MSKRVSNREIAHYAAQGIACESTNMTFYNKNVPYTHGRLPGRASNALFRRQAQGHIQGIIYSYSTPIAWLDEGVWIFPDVSYSPSTGKHQSSLYGLGLNKIPYDVSEHEYERIHAGLMQYVPDYTHRTPGKMIPGLVSA